MYKKTIITILLALVAMAVQGQVPLESVKELTMKSEYFNHERQLLIYTPDNYPNFDQTYYDVIYVFDAQDRTMFDLVHCLLNIACKPDPSTGGQTPCEQGKSLGVFKDCLLDERDFASRNRNAFGAKLHAELHAS